jgi:hypothetical protein
MSLHLASVPGDEQSRAGRRTVADRVVDGGESIGRPRRTGRRSAV